MAKDKAQKRFSDYVNYGLLCAMVTLVVSGVVAFWQPFSLTNARIHVFAALFAITLLLLHLLLRKHYFVNGWTKRKSKTRNVFLSVLLIGTVLLSLAVYNLAPVKQLVASSYEATNTREIVRTHSLTGITLGRDSLVGVRQTQEGGVQLNLNLQFKHAHDDDLAIAIWASSTSGSLIETLYISPEFAFSDKVNWFGKQVNRADVLPIWRHKYTLVNGLNPNGEIDATTGATANHQFTLSTYLEGLNSEFVLNVEINRANDETKKWPNAVTGEPSILYTTYIENLPQQSNYSLLELTGHGGSTGALGKVQYQLDEIEKSTLPLEFGLISIVSH